MPGEHPQMAVTVALIVNMLLFLWAVLIPSFEVVVVRRHVDGHSGFQAPCLRSHGCGVPPLCPPLNLRHSV